MLYVAFRTYGQESYNPGFPANYPSNCIEVDAPDLATAQSMSAGLAVLSKDDFNSYLAGLRATSAAQIDAALGALQAQDTAVNPPTPWWKIWA